MTTEVIEYTYTTYRTPQQQEHEINYYVDFAEQLDTYLRNKGFLPDRGRLPEKTQIFWCTFPSLVYISFTIMWYLFLVTFSSLQ